MITGSEEEYLGDEQHAADQKARENVVVVRTGPQPYLHLHPATPPYHQISATAEDPVRANLPLT